MGEVSQPSILPDGRDHPTMAPTLHRTALHSHGFRVLMLGMAPSVEHQAASLAAVPELVGRSQRIRERDRMYYFSNFDIPPTSRLSSFQEHLCSTYHDCTVWSPDNPENFGAMNCMGRTIGRTLLGESRNLNFRLTRNGHARRWNGEQTCTLVLPTQGVITHNQRKKASRTEAGGALILNDTEDWQTDHADGRVLSLTCPISFISEALPLFEDASGDTIVCDPLLIGTLRYVTKRALQADTISDHANLMGVVVPLLDMMISRRSDRFGEGWRYSDTIASVIAEKARSFMRDRFGDPELNLLQVARACNVSTRQLQSAFQKEKQTFVGELGEIRLQAARRMLQSRNLSTRQIGQIALQCGFVSQAYFSTRYKQRFGHSPKDESHDR